MNVANLNEVFIGSSRDESVQSADKMPVPQPMLRAGVIAAGHGERLRSATSHKPLALVAGRTLIEHTLTAMSDTGATEVVVIINHAATEVRDRTDKLAWPFTLRWIVETTPSSMHSFLRVMETLSANDNDGPFLISTVDTIASPGSYAGVIGQAQRHPDVDVVFALTSAGMGDENPLLMKYNPQNKRISAIGPAAAPSDHITAGVYAIRPNILKEAEEARCDGISALRHFFVRLLDRGYILQGFPVDHSIDVDKPRDISAAEDFLKRMSK